jgi:hypothetical protein
MKPTWLVVFTAGAIYGQDADLVRMREIDRALGVECAHCHVDQDWKRSDKPEFAFAVRMMKMTDGLSSGTLRNLGGVACWSCHRGHQKPERMARASWEDVLAKWPDALKLSAEDAKRPMREVYKNIQLSPSTAQAGGLPMTMSVYSAALGVACDYCHVPGNWDSDEKKTKVTARAMVRMFGEIPVFFEQGHQPSMQCYSCHQGAAKPQHKPA